MAFICVTTAALSSDEGTVCTVARLVITDCFFELPEPDPAHAKTTAANTTVITPSTIGTGIFLDFFPCSSVIAAHCIAKQAHTQAPAEPTQPLAQRVLSR